MSNADWRGNSGEWPVPFVGVPFEIGKSALIIIDMQRYWTDPNGPIQRMLEANYPASLAYFRNRLKTVIPNLKRLLTAYRKRALPVVHVTTGAVVPNGSDLAPHLRRRIASDRKVSGEFHLLRVGGEWHAVEPDLVPCGGEMVFNKTTRSPFHSTGIDQTLQHMGVTHVVIGGIASNACVELTARDAADRGYETYLVEDACGTFLEEAHIPVFRSFAWLFGTVLTTDEVLRE